jgi:hypothetical protein
VRFRITSVPGDNPERSMAPRPFHSKTSDSVTIVGLG